MKRRKESQFFFVFFSRFYDTLPKNEEKVKSNQGGMGSLKKQTYHVIRNERQMPKVDLDTVNTKDARNLVDDARSGGFDTVSVKDGGDVVGLDVAHVDELVSVFPHSLEVGTFRQQSSLRRGRRKAGKSVNKDKNEKEDSFRGDVSQ